MLTCWSDQLRKQAPDTETLIIESEQVLKKHCFFILTANVIDETTADKLIEIGVKKGSDYFPQVKRKSGTGQYSLQANIRHFVISEFQQLYGKVYSPSANDSCILNFSGIIFKEELE